MTPDKLTEAADQMAMQLREIEDPAIREATCRVVVAVARTIRAETLRELHAKLGSWEKVGDAVGLPRQDCWRMAKG